MKADKASQTAQYMALFRALETTQPVSKRLFIDPYAIAFLDGKLNLAPPGY
jgi:O-methyltransferase involved in polyketide biosynthesis